MGVFDFSDYKIITGGSSVDAKSKTLVISSHGWKNGGTFTRPYPTVVQFCTPSNTMLFAPLMGVINGKVTPVELATGVQIKLEDYNLICYRGDPQDMTIEGALSGTSFDVMVFREDAATIGLSNVLTSLKSRGYLYPSIWCLFCRVTAQQYERTGRYEGGGFLGKKSASTMAMNIHKVNATAIALELQSKGKKQ